MKRKNKIVTFEQLNRKEYIKNTFAFLLIMGALTFASQFLFSRPAVWFFYNLQPPTYMIITETVVTLLYRGIGIYVPFLIYNLIKYKKTGRFFTKESARIKPSFYILGAIAVTGAALAIIYLTTLWTEPLVSVYNIKEPYMPKLYESDNPAVYAVFIVAAAVIPSFFGELTYRGIVIDDMRKDSAFYAVLAGAVLSAFSVPSIRVAPMLFVIGLMLGWLKIKSGSTVVTFVASCCAYGAVASLYVMKITAPDTFNAVAPYTALGGLLAALAASVMLCANNGGIAFSEWTNLTKKEATKAFFLNIGFFACVIFFILRILMSIVKIPV